MIRIGDTVALTPMVARRWLCPDGRQNNPTAKVLSILDGHVHVDRDLRGCLWWNVEDLQRIERKS